MHTDTLIIGGGLSGLSLADGLAQSGADFLLVEAQERLGGRILTQNIGGVAFDFGPAWFWPRQPRIAALIDRLDLQAFEQFSTGATVFQNQNGAVQHHQGFGAMQGSLRVAGGMGALIDGLRANLPKGAIRVGTRLTTLTRIESGIEVRLRTSKGHERIHANRVVLAIPPRVAAATIRFEPSLPAEMLSAMEQIPTWMAGQAKILAVYDQPHWRNAGLSGDGMSQKGPMTEIHDASPSEGGPYALFGFVGFPPEMRRQYPERTLDLAQEQLIAMFGAEMAAPLSLMMQDWAGNPAIATERDQVSPRFHPAYGLPQALSDLWSGDLILASTETSRQFGGFLEGAVEAAENVERRLMSISGAVAISI